MDKEITEEMIKAGMRVYLDWEGDSPAMPDREEDDIAELSGLFKDIYKAMKAKEPGIKTGEFVNCTPGYTWNERPMRIGEIKTK